MSNWEKFKWHWLVRRTERALVYGTIIALFSISLGLFLGDIWRGYGIVSTAYLGWNLWIWAREEFQFV